MTDEDRSIDESGGRRDFLRKSAYVVPAILTLQAFSAVAKAGSAKAEFAEDEGIGGKEKKPKKPKKK